MLLKNYVDGKFFDNTNGASFPVVNPATGQEAYRVELADDTIRNAALASAQRGFDTWSAMTGMERGRILLKAVALLREHNDELAAIEVIDTGMRPGDLHHLQVF